MSITNEEIIADIQKALVATLEEVSELGLKYTTVVYTGATDIEKHRGNAVAEVMAILINLRFGDAGSQEAIRITMESLVNETEETVH